MLYTTVTVADFKDADYINKLKELSIGIELALITYPFVKSNQVNDLKALKEEIAEFVECFETFDIPLQKTRIHQPGGYLYHWEDENFEMLKSFFVFCAGFGFEQFTVHSPYRNLDVDQEVELKDFREKLHDLGSVVKKLEVEEIFPSCTGEGDEPVRCYHGSLFEKLVCDQKATVLLDTYECGGVDATINRIDQLQAKDFSIKTIHIHKNGHHFLSPEELGQLFGCAFAGTIVNEGFLKPGATFKQFVQTKSTGLVMPNSERIEILKEYKKQIESC